jgi:hypothetical protein
MKINTWLSKSIYFLWPCICREQDYNIIFSTHIHRTLTVLSFRAGHISSTLCNIIFGTLVARDCRFFCSTEIYSSHMMDCWLCKKSELLWSQWHNFLFSLCIGISFDPESKHNGYRCCLNTSHFIGKCIYISKRQGDVHCAFGYTTNSIT